MGTSHARRRRDDDWKPRLKDRKKRGPAVGSASSRAADAAIANLKTIDRRVRRGIGVDERYLEKVAQALDPAAAARRQAAAESRPRADMRPLALGGGIAAVCILGAVCWGMLGTAAHSVTGTVLLDGRPLGNVEVCFHPVAEAAADPAAERDQRTFRATSADNGGFHLDALPAGPYAITLHADSADGAVVPPAYGKPATTKFRLKLARDLPGIQLYATSKPAGR